MSIKTVYRGMALAGLALLLAGCNESEQNRPLSYDKGTYQGAPDEKLDNKTVRDLDQRIRNQNAS